MLSHLLGLIGFLGPLIFWLIKKDQSPVVAREAKEALNFEITIAIAVIICAVLMVVLIGFFLLPLVALTNCVFVIIAAVKANKEGSYRYPFALRLIK